MSHAAIAVENLGKLYRIEHAGAGSRTFRDLLTDAATAPFRRFRQLSGSHKSMEDFWALRDVSFDVQPGEVVGIIGRNGAGKSTLLKILSRIVEPTRGQATMRGRVASLLEVGTGFHPELTGRENIFLNGSILGMKKREISARFDEMVTFAEIEKFLDTPVKRYSSGMYVRLAFAVAAHLQPEILIVDEVLAVGDAAFQKKCLGKMKEVSSQAGRTVLFVSHNVAAIRGLCSHALWLREGKLALNGTAENVTGAYVATMTESASARVDLRRPSGAQMWMTRASLLVDGQPASTAPMGSELQLAVNFESSLPTRHPTLSLVVQTADGERLLNSDNNFQASPEFAEPVRSGSIVCDLGAPPLMPGRYTISVWLANFAGHQHIEIEALGFEVTEKDLWGLGRTPPPTSLMWWPSTFHFHDELVA